MKTLIINCAALLLLLVGGRGADNDSKDAAIAAALEKTKFADYPQDAPERPKGYFLTETDGDHTLGILMPTMETDGVIHNYIADIQHNKIIGEIDNGEDEADAFGRSHGGIKASWTRVSGKKILGVITYHGKWGEHSLRVIEIHDSGKEAKKNRYGIDSQVDILPLVVEKLEAAVHRVNKKAEVSEVADMSAFSFRVDRVGRVLIEATGSDEASHAKKGGDATFSVSIIGCYDLKTGKLAVLDTSPVNSGVQ